MEYTIKDILGMIKVLDFSCIKIILDKDVIYDDSECEYPGDFYKSLNNASEKYGKKTLEEIKFKVVQFHHTEITIKTK